MTNLGLLLPSAVSQSPTILFPRSSHSPSTFTPDKSLCFTCTLRPPSRNSEIYTLQNEYTIKKNLHFSSIFSLFRLISSHIHIWAYPFQVPSIIYFHGEDIYTPKRATNVISKEWTKDTMNAMRNSYNNMQELNKKTTLGFAKIPYIYIFAYNNYKRFL